MKKLFAASILIIAIALLLHNYFSASYSPSEAVARFHGKSLAPQQIPWPIFNLGLAFVNAFDQLLKSLKPPELIAMETTLSFWTIETASLLARYKIFDYLDDAGTKGATAVELAEKVAKAMDGDGKQSIQIRLLFRILRFASQVDLVLMDPGHDRGTIDSADIMADASVESTRFYISSVGMYYSSKRPYSMHALLLMNSDQMLPAWRGLRKTIRNGNPGFVNEFGEDIWSWFAKNKEEGKLFDDAMTAISSLIAPQFLSEYRESLLDFKKELKVDKLEICDVGGGQGTLLSDILLSFPKDFAHGTVLDLPGVIENAKVYLETKGLTSDHATAISANFFEPIPVSCDVYLMKHIIHDWDDDSANQILQNVRKSMKKNPRAKILLLETVLGTSNQLLERTKYGADLQMMAACASAEAKERSEKQFFELLRDAGLKLNRITPMQGPLAIVEAILA